MVHSYRVLIIYLVGVLAGCLSNSAVFPSHSLRGASAGVNSLYTAHIASVIIVIIYLSHKTAQNFIMYKCFRIGER